jgi:hypothetical protein
MAGLAAGWQAKACPTLFHEVSRAEGPFKQTTKSDGLSGLSHLPQSEQYWG